MAGAFKYMIDERGEKTSVLVPIKTWQKITKDYFKLPLWSDGNRPTKVIFLLK